MDPGRVVAIGECMVELSLEGPAAAHVGYAGDTFNTAVYLSRLGRRVAFATALGEGDPFSAGILARMDAEGIGRELVTEAEGRLPGLYAIERDEDGERSFHYWRGEAPVRDLFRLADLGALAAAIREAELVYLSGVTLAVIGEDGRAALSAMLREAKAVAFDLNYRPRLWSGPQAARAAAEAVAPACAYVFIGEGEAAAVYGEGGYAAAEAWGNAGVELVWRTEDRTLTVFEGGAPRVFPAEEAVPAVDTTGAGDSFNAGYLAARLAGGSVAEAVQAGRRLAAVVVSHPGAIIPREAMPG